jgi:hypothetical protein
MVVWGCGSGGATAESRQLKRVTGKEQQLIDLNTAPRVLTDRAGEAGFSVLWSYVKDVVVCNNI